VKDEIRGTGVASEWNYYFSLLKYLKISNNTTVNEMSLAQLFKCIYMRYSVCGKMLLKFIAELLPVQAGILIYRGSILHFPSSQPPAPSSQLPAPGFIRRNEVEAGSLPVIVENHFLK
jgi:hypothetical protein